MSTQFIIGLFIALAVTLLIKLGSTGQSGASSMLGDLVDFMVELIMVGVFVAVFIFAAVLGTEQAWQLALGYGSVRATIFCIRCLLSKARR